MKNTIKILMIMGALFQGTTAFATKVNISNGPSGQYKVTGELTSCNGDIAAGQNKICDFNPGKIVIHGGYKDHPDVSCEVLAVTMNGKDIIGSEGDILCGNEITLKNSAHVKDENAPIEIMLPG